MKFCKMFLFLLLMIMDVSTNAQEITCEGEQLINVDILIGHPGIAPPYKPGHILVFRCTDVNLKMHGQQTIECRSNGKWNYPYPKCEEVTCLLNTNENNIKMELFPDFECPVKPGYNVTFSCNGQGLILKGQREITCQSNGEWSSPFPKCEVSVKCGPPPRVNNADTVEMTKKEYNTGERVEYICFNKYILDQRHSFTKYLTCQQGQWTGNVKCLKPCTVTKELMAERGIDLAYVNQQKMFAPHNDHITFVCLRGKNPVGITDFRQKCNDGEINLPECV
ncbi:complement factor H-related protein 4-like isoform X3 [Onychostoma macrolepis]|nr:complement factor H-related protein 4-like isoform X3 [Onychostoma macrolepis]XP_058615941.1 complement factor H-related protein 4-like isoform X3 [Onychostoma macrolepis]